MGLGWERFSRIRWNGSENIGRGSQRDDGCGGYNGSMTRIVGTNSSLDDCGVNCPQRNAPASGLIVSRPVYSSFNDLAIAPRLIPAAPPRGRLSNHTFNHSNIRALSIIDYGSLSLSRSFRLARISLAL